MFLRSRLVTPAAAAEAPEILSAQSAEEAGIQLDQSRAQNQGHDGNHKQKGRQTRRWRSWVMLTPRRVKMCTCYTTAFAAAFALVFASSRQIAMAGVAREGRKLARTPRAGLRSGEGVERGSSSSFTVLLNTFERPQQLEEAVRHYASCNGVESVRVAWSEQSPAPNRATNAQLFAHSRPVEFHAYPTTSINNRFIPPEHLATDAVFVVDDDIAVPCDHLLAAFGTWARHPDALVGFYPRSHAFYSPRDNGNVSGLWEYLYFWRVLWSSEYSMVLTKAAFVHAKYLRLYSGAQPTGAVGGSGDGVEDGALNARLVEAMMQTRAYVDTNRNCEDIAMQMAVTSASGTAPVAAFAPVKDIGLFGGISTGEGKGKWWQAPHAMKRSRCLADLHQIFCSALDGGAAGSHGSHTASSGKHVGECGALRRTNLFAATPQWGGDNSGGLSTLSRWALAVRAPSMADFISADMLLVPGKVWKWFAKDDILGRVPA